MYTLPVFKYHSWQDDFFDVAEIYDDDVVATLMEWAVKFQHLAENFKCVAKALRGQSVALLEDAITLEAKDAEATECLQALMTAGYLVDSAEDIAERAQLDGD
jgi:hypothetical protein